MEEPNCTIDQPDTRNINPAKIRHPLSFHELFMVVLMPLAVLGAMLYVDGFQLRAFIVAGGYAIVMQVIMRVNRYNQRAKMTDRPTTKEMEVAINDTAVSDDQLFGKLMAYVADMRDAFGNSRPITEAEINEFEYIRELLYQKRPAVIKELLVFTFTAHSDCCPKDPR